MKIILVRRISQIFFFALFAWFCIVSTVGERFWQLRGWPVDLFLELDPLVAIGTIASTHTLYWPLLWALLTIALTFVFGRYFCGWVCPFGTIHQFAGYLWNRKVPISKRLALNAYRKLQYVKYYILIVFLVMAFVPFSTSSLQTGLLDPISLITRTFNLALLPIADMKPSVMSAAGRFYEGALLVILIFFAAVFMNLIIPRFYCRFICPLGALLGILSRNAVFRIGKNENHCTDCKRCNAFCEGACEPSGRIRVAECVLCLNCREECGEEAISYQTVPSAGGEIVSSGISRRGFLVSLTSSLFITPAFRLGRQIDNNWYHLIIRPPGALEEEEFLKRCIKCGQCMRVCPTNVIQPGGMEGGFENLWTPLLNNRIGSSGCQHNCVTCGQVCPTSAIRPISLDEKHGKGRFKDAGFIRIGTAFVDRNRCLPWTMDRPCIVCQENCPVSPKAIYTDEMLNTIRGGIASVRSAQGNIIELSGGEFDSGNVSGDYYCLIRGTLRRKIVTLSEKKIVLERGAGYTVSKGDRIEIQVRLQRPYVDIKWCNGCGICEHECPVSGLRAIRVSGVGESRSAKRAMMISPS
jgi:ferredoxin